MDLQTPSPTLSSPPPPAPTLPRGTEGPSRGCWAKLPSTPHDNTGRLTDILTQKSWCDSDCHLCKNLQEVNNPAKACPEETVKTSEKQMARGQQVRPLRPWMRLPTPQGALRTGVEAPTSAWVSRGPGHRGAGAAGRASPIGGPRAASRVDPQGRTDWTVASAGILIATGA